MDFSKLSLSDKIIGGTAIVLILDLVVLPWHSVSVSVGPYSSSYTRSGIQSPNALWGILALLLAIAIVAVIIVRKLADVDLPEVPQPWGRLTFFATIAVAVLLVIKLIAETDYLGIGAWLALLLGAGMVYGGFVGKDEPDAAGATSGPGDSGGAPF